MRTLFGLLALLFIHVPLYAQVDCAPECGSQLLRVDIAANALNNNSVQGLLPGLNKLAESPTLKAAIENKFPLEGFGFPHNLESCLSEKAENDPDFKDIDCSAKDLCSNTALNPNVRERICFKLPCAILEGDQQVGKCKDESDIYPTNISFPTPVDIKKISIAPTKVELKNGKANLCFRMNELEINMSTKLTIDTSRTDLRDNAIEVTNINPKLDGPRDLCVTANIDIASNTPISNLQIVQPGNEPFFSDNMLREAAGKLEIKGLSGYKDENLKAIQSEVVPALFQPLRSTIETAVKDSLSKVFNDQIHATIDPLVSGKTTTVDSQSFMSELGIMNIQVKDQLAKVECAALSQAKMPIPENHACIGLPTYFDGPITTAYQGDTFAELSYLERLMSSNNITSESVKQRLIAIKDVMLARPIPEIFTKNDTPEQIAKTEIWFRQSVRDNIKKEVDPLIDSINKAQLESQMYNIVGIESKVNDGLSNSLGLVIPEICTPKPSPHAGKKMPNCPVQVYADLQEFNKVLGKMWESGRLCMRGRGEYRPKLDEYDMQAYDTEGRPLVRGGCELTMAGMSCYVKNPPQLKYDAKTKKYNVGIALTNCYRGPVILGLGRFGGDFNIDFDFKPSACSNGDFCMADPEAKWSIVPGTERFGLRESSFFDKMIKEKINEAVTGAVKDTIRIPMASGVGPLGSVPLRAEGRVDTGPGYFGVCLEIPSEGASAQ